MLVRIILTELKIDISSIVAEHYLIQAMAKFNFDDSEKITWLRSNSVSISHMRITEPYTNMTREIIYTYLDEKLAVEYYLRF